MARRKEVVGTCCLCLETTVLTFEHVPPEGAFNDRPVILADINRLIGKDLYAELLKARGRENQRGAGRYSLCKACNVNTGNWYTRSYIDLVQAAMPAFSMARAGEAYAFSVTIRQLKVLKQILTMFCSACGPGFARAHSGVPRYLLNPESRQLPAGIDVYLALLDRKTMATRQSGISGRIDLDSQRVLTYSEFSFPPFDVVMALDSPAPDPNLMRVTWFNQYSLNEQRQVALALHCVQTNTYLPADYSTRERLEEISAKKFDGAA
jgi:hypothetical protein